MHDDDIDIIPCECHTEGIHFAFFNELPDEQIIELSLWGIDPQEFTFLEKIKYAFRILRGRKISENWVILSYPNADRLARRILFHTSQNPTQD